MASEICHSGSKGSMVDFRPKGFFESRGWSRSSKRNPGSSPSSTESSPRAEETMDRQSAVSSVACSDTAGEDDDYQFLFGRVWQTNAASGPSPAEALASQNPRPDAKPSTPLSWRRYGFKRHGGGSAVDCNKTDSLMENSKVKGGSGKGESTPEFTTVSVGEGKGKRVQYTISSDILRHHLFQVLLKCSHADVRDANQSNSRNPSADSTCVSVSCDPALFLQLVRVVGGDGCLSTEPQGNVIS